MEVEIGRGKKARRAYGFDDIAIVPSRRTRDPDDVDISWKLGDYRFDLPLMASAMDGVVSPRTAGIVGKLGGLAVLNLEGIWSRYENADEMLQRAQDAPGLPGLGFGRHGGPGGPGFGARGEVMEKVAAKLKLTEEQLHTRLHSGRTLAAIAKAQGVSRAELVATITAALKAEGVPAARAADLAKHIADDAHRGPGGRRGFHP